MRRRALLIADLAALPAGLALSQAGRPADARRVGPVNLEDGGIGIGGHDPVAYFTETRPVPGRADVSAVHEEVTYRFASEANRAAFLA